MHSRTSAPRRSLGCALAWRVFAPAATAMVGGGGWRQRWRAPWGALGVELQAKCLGEFVHVVLAPYLDRAPAPAPVSERLMESQHGSTWIAAMVGTL